MPYAEELSARLCSDDDPLENAMKVGAHHLARCYRALSSDEIFAGPVLVENSRKFAAPCDSRSTGCTPLIMESQRST